MASWHVSQYLQNYQCQSVCLLGATSTAQVSGEKPLKKQALLDTSKIVKTRSSLPLADRCCTRSLVEPKTPRSPRKNAATRILMMGDVRRGRPPKVPRAEVVMPEASGAVRTGDHSFGSDLGLIVFHRFGMGSLLARVLVWRVSYGSASGLEPFGPLGLAVARGGDSSANGRAARPAKMAHCNPPSLPIPAISNLIFCKSTKTRAMTSTPLGSHGVFPKMFFITCLQTDLSCDKRGINKNKEQRTSEHVATPSLENLEKKVSRSHR